MKDQLHASNDTEMLGLGSVVPACRPSRRLMRALRSRRYACEIRRETLKQIFCVT